MIGHLARTPLTVWRPSTTSDGAGGQVTTYTLAGHIRAQVSQPNAEERMLAAQAGAELSHVVHAVAGVDVRRGDELDGPVPSPLPDGHRLRVLAVIANSRSTYTRIECEVIQTEGS